MPGTSRRKPSKRNDRILRFEIAKLELHDGDMLAVSTPMILSREQSVALRDQMLAHVPKGVEVVVLSAGLKLSIVRDKRTEDAA